MGVERGVVDKLLRSSNLRRRKKASAAQPKGSEMRRQARQPEPVRRSDAQDSTPRSGPMASVSVASIPAPAAPERRRPPRGRMHPPARGSACPPRCVPNEAAPSSAMEGPPSTRRWIGRSRRRRHFGEATVQANPLAHGRTDCLVLFGGRCAGKRHPSLGTKNSASCEVCSRTYAAVAMSDIAQPCQPPPNLVFVRRAFGLRRRWNDPQELQRSKDL